MTIQEENNIDMIGFDESRRVLVLAISDHLTWEDVNQHLDKLTKKVDTYVQFVNGPDIKKQFPQYQGGKVEFRIYLEHRPPMSMNSYIDNLQNMLTRLNSNIMITVAQ